MTKTLTLALGLTALATPAAASECSAMVHQNDGSWTPARNTCQMMREGSDTFVKMGAGLIIIARDPHEQGVAKLFTITSDGRRAFAGTALAAGPCWISRHLKFCSE